MILDNFNDYYDPKIKRENIAALGDQAGGNRRRHSRRSAGRAGFRAASQSRGWRISAAMASVRYSAERGRLYADVNTSATVSLMDAARKHGVSVFVFGSTSSVYGNTARVPFVEDDAAAHPLAPYPASKRAAEIFAYTYHQLFGLNVNILRFFNVYGPHGRPDMMPLRAIESILSGETIEMYDGGRSCSATGRTSTTLSMALPPRWSDRSATRS